ncbi:MAG: hemolysin family protein [Bacteroidota bacterium]|nr:hemolysin family protein [Bacteroidota bacterium]
MISEIFLLIITLMLSALYSASEISFIVASRLKAEIRSKQNTFLSKRTLDLISNPQKFLTISLVGTNISNVAFSTLLTILLVSLFDIGSTFVLIITVIVILIFGEIIPKIFFRENADASIPFFTLFLSISNFIFYPLILILIVFTRSIIQLFKVTETAEKYFFTKEDVYSLIKESEGVGKPDAKSTSYLMKVFELKDILIREIMIPRTEISCVAKNISMNQLRDKFNESTHSKLFVYEETIDNIIGVVSVQDMFSEPDSVLAIMHEVLYVPETKSSSDLLQQFYTTGVSVAVAIDEFGGTSGIVSVYDILEEVLGKIDETQLRGRQFHKQIDAKTFQFSGRLEIEFINETYKLDIPEGENITLSGYISEKIGHIPKANETFKIDNFKVTIQRATKTRIDSVLFEIE